MNLFIKGLLIGIVYTIFALPLAMQLGKMLRERNTDQGS